MALGVASRARNGTQSVHGVELSEASSRLLGMRGRTRAAKAGDDAVNRARADAMVRGGRDPAQRQAAKTSGGRRPPPK